jgi:hypothetical protein
LLLRHALSLSCPPYYQGAMNPERILGTPS